MMIMMTMMLRMMMMEMLALLVRCLLDTLTLCHSWQKWEVVLDIRVVILKERVRHIFVRGSVVFIEGCSEDTMYLFFSFLFRYIVLVHKVLWPFIDIHCTYLFHLWLMYVFSFTYPFICCFFFCFIHMFLITCTQSIYFCFTERCLDEFCLKCFRNIGCQSLFVINSLLAKFFKILW